MLLCVTILLFLLHQTRPEPCNLITYPFVVTLRSRSYHHICGGTLLQTRWVITAAHCVYEHPNPAEFLIVARIKESSVFQSVHVRDVFIHDLYDHKTLENDMSLLLLVRGFPEVSSFAGFASKELTSYFMDSGEVNGTIMAWESNQPNAPKASKLLMEPHCITVRTLQAYDCGGSFERFLNPAVMFCGVAFTNEQPCRGDSGSPVLVNGVLTGLVSFGTNCKQRLRTPSVFGRVDYGVDFIAGTARKFGYDVANSTVKGLRVYYMPAGGRRVAARGAVVVFALLLSVNII